MVCCCPDWVPTTTPKVQPALSSDALAGMIAAGAIILLLLIIFLFILLLLMSKRRRMTKSTYKSSAHDNPTYMTHRDINANLAAGSASPVDLVFDADGAIGATFYADEEKKKVRLGLGRNSDFIV